AGSSEAPSIAALFGKGKHTISLPVDAWHAPLLAVGARGQGRSSVGARAGSARGCPSSAPPPGSPGRRFSPAPPLGSQISPAQRSRIRCNAYRPQKGAVVLGLGPQNLGVRLRRIHSGGAGAAPPLAGKGACRCCPAAVHRRSRSSQKL